MKRIACMIFVAAAWLACAESADRAGSSECAVGEPRACTCDNGTFGTQRCSDLGQYGACECAALPAPAEAGPPVCGDGVCNGADTCRSCAQDCGECGKCALAPSCTNAVGIPSNPTTRHDLDQPREDAGATAPDAGSGAGSCKDPELRLRIASVKVNKGGGQVYCVVSATDGATSEAAVTAKTKSLGDNETNFFDATTALYWGQKDLHRTTNNLTVTFNCFIVKSDAWAKVLGAMGNTAKDLGGTPTPYGWAFGIGGIAANAAAAAVAAGAGDDLRFNAQQTIDRSELLDLTNGRAWTLRQGGGCGLFCQWDWEIRVESWGCADAEVKPK
ncbi:MAG TPA: hypothetical protein VLT33_19370 [Labilithrix sp.]|nr:hypothetical protein [Labilithrix sp.]